MPKRIVIEIGFGIALQIVMAQPILLFEFYSLLLFMLKKANLITDYAVWQKDFMNKKLLIKLFLEFPAKI